MTTPEISATPSADAVAHKPKPFKPKGRFADGLPKPRASFREIVPFNPSTALLTDPFAQRDFLKAAHDELATTLTGYSSMRSPHYSGMRKGFAVLAEELNVVTKGVIR